MEEKKTDWCKVCEGLALFFLGIIGLGLAAGLIITAQAFGAQWSEAHIIAASILAAFGGIGGLFGVLFGFFIAADNWY